eukprot:735634-Amphidinium_carterae.1
MIIVAIVWFRGLWRGVCWFCFDPCRGIQQGVYHTCAAVGGRKWCARSTAPEIRKHRNID